LGEKITALATNFENFSKSIATSLEDAMLNSSSKKITPFLHSKHLPCLERTGFESLGYWFRGPWSDAKNRKVNVDTEDPVLVLFCEDAHGKIMAKGEIRAVRSSVKAYFEFLWTGGIAPSCWGDAPLDLRIDFVRRMEEEYGWLRYCHRHWKSEQLFMNYYPQWYKTKTTPRKSKRKERAVDGEHEHSNDTPSGSKRPRVEEPEPEPAPPSPPPPPQPVPTSVTTARRRVSLVLGIGFLFSKILQKNPL
jgi:hypothetical protein